MNKLRKSKSAGFKQLLWALIIVLEIASGQINALAQVHAKAPRTVAQTEVYHLSTVGPRRVSLICVFRSGAPRIAVQTAVVDTGVRYREILNTFRNRRIIKAAKAECSALSDAPACSDSRDNDGDQLIDYPEDPGCANEDSQSEVSATAGACSDGVDNDGDGDGKIDYPNDPGCTSADDTDETDPASITPYMVFRKPFDGTFYLTSLFDHQYPQEFVHTDGVIITASNHQTTLGVDGHEGYDFSMPEGTPILATYDGTVELAGAETPFYCPLLQKTVSGNFVRIKHNIENEKFVSVYLHFSSISVATGDTVTKGQQIGLSGNTGCSTGPHLHFDIKRTTNTNGGSRASIDPFGWKSSATDPWAVHAEGTASFDLWDPNFTPEPYKRVTLTPNPKTGDNARVAITTIRYDSVLGDDDPNTEYIELTLDPRYATSGSYVLGGLSIRNNAHDVYTFSSGFTIYDGSPVRIYSGTGTDTATELYWGKDHPIWSNSGDCSKLLYASGNTMYTLYYGSAGCTSALSGHTPGGESKIAMDALNPKR